MPPELRPLVGVKLPPEMRFGIEVEFGGECGYAVNYKRVWAVRSSLSRDAHRACVDQLALVASVCER